MPWPVSVTLRLIPDKQYLIVGVAFYNLENLFDTINANGKYDLEFSPQVPANGIATNIEKKSTTLREPYRPWLHPKLRSVLP